jgi:MFS family permease
MKTDVFRALKGRNFRLYLMGQGCSLIGTWMQQIGMSWLVYDLTRSTLLLGATSFINQIPTFFLSPLAGAWADRTNRRRLILGTQTLLMLQAALLAWLTLTDQIQVWHVILLGLFFGLVNAADIPARQSFFYEIVGNRDDIANAIALNASMVNMTRLVGPALAGIVVAAYGEGWCFFVNALSFTTLIAALLLMRLPKIMREPPSRSIWLDLREGVRHAFGNPLTRRVLTLLALTSLLGTPFSTLMPVFASDVFGGGAKTLGFLTAASGAGALGGALYMTSLQPGVDLQRRIWRATLALSGALALFGISKWYLLSLALLFVSGFGMMVMMGLSNTLLQVVSAETKRGRIMSFYVMCLIGVAPMGALLAGAVSHLVGAPATVSLSGVACLMAALWYRQNC